MLARVELESWICPSIVLRKAARRRARKTPIVMPLISLPLPFIVFWGEIIVRLSISVAVNNELAHVLLSYMDYRVFESETNTTHCEIVRYCFVFDLPKL